MAVFTASSSPAPASQLSKLPQAGWPRAAGLAATKEAALDHADHEVPLYTLACQ